MKQFIHSPELGIAMATALVMAAQKSKARRDNDEKEHFMLHGTGETARREKEREDHNALIAAKKAEKQARRGKK